MKDLKHLSQTRRNLEASFAGESMAHQKYLYFARVARRQGDEETAHLFEEIAKQETSHARGHLELLYPPEELTSERMLQLAIEGETYEYSEMYPGFEKTAVAEQEQAAAQEFAEQIEESKEHALTFQVMLEKAEKRFRGLAKVEQRHAGAYQHRLDEVAGTLKKTTAPAQSETAAHAG